MSGYRITITASKAHCPTIRSIGFFHTTRHGFSTTGPRYNTGDLKVTDRMGLQNKTILVTGGGRGIGFAVCKSIAQMGGNVAVIDTLPSPVPDFTTLSKNYNIQASYHRGDVTDQKSLESAFNEAVQASPNESIQGCVTAAGIVIDKPFLSHQWEESKRVLDVNVMGTFWTSRLVAQHMANHRQGGSIVLIASIAAQGIKIPKQNVAVYNMSKAAVKGLVGPLAVELAQVGVRVNSISPGVIMSPMTEGLKKEYPVSNTFEMLRSTKVIRALMWYRNCWRCSSRRLLCRGSVCRKISRLWSCIYSAMRLGSLQALIYRLLAGCMLESQCHGSNDATITRMCEQPHA